jgi:hypothetical protein
MSEDMRVAVAIYGPPLVAIAVATMFAWIVRRAI